MSHSSARLLFLAPELYAPNGGIQAAGRAAWDAINRPAMTVSGFEVKAELFCYGDGVDGAGVGKHAKEFHVSSKLEALVAAARRRWTVTFVIVWHIGLLKLLTFSCLPHTKVVLFVHGIEAWRPQDWLTRRVLRHISLFLTNSDYTWNRFLSFNPELVGAPHRTVPLGLGLPGAASTRDPSNPPVVLMISRLAKSEDYKGHRETINAWPLVLGRIPKAQLWIAGDGDLKRELEWLVAARGLQRSIQFWGRVSEETKEELIRHCRCVALPSRGEGFGLVYLEAMRMARPCLVSDQDAGREVVNPPEAGLAADPDDPDELADTVCRLLSGGTEWQRWSRQAKARYEGYFTAAHFQRRLIAVLREDLSSQPEAGS